LREREAMVQEVYSRLLSVGYDTFKIREPSLWHKNLEKAIEVFRPLTVQDDRLVVSAAIIPSATQKQGREKLRLLPKATCGKAV
jgi:hypothetical protein